MIDYSRDELLTQQSFDLLKSFYLLPGENSPQDGFARAAAAFCGGDKALAERMYNYTSKKWAMYSSPILSNAPRGRWVGDKFFKDKSRKYGMPISCFLSYVPDNIKGQIETASELAYLSVNGGGTAAHNGIRAISDKAPGPIPYMKTIDSNMGYYRQGKSRRGACCYYMDDSHPDIEEHIDFRLPTGGDPARKADNRKSFHTAVNITRAFYQAIESDSSWDLFCPHTGEVRKTMPARKLWGKIMNARELRGGPFLHFIDVSNRELPKELRDKGLRVNGSNLCTEITLPTSEFRTAVCCLMSLNLEYYDEWKSTRIVRDCIRFLDNVISYFIEYAPPELARAVYSAKQERSLGLGAFGFHSYLQKNNIPWESGGFGSAVQKNHQIFKHIKQEAVAETKLLGAKRGHAPDMMISGRRNSHLLAIAPNANSASIAGASPSCEPWSSNIFVSSSRAGSHIIKNKHLEKLVKEKGLDTQSFWSDIRENGGSIQHRPEFSDEEKEVFKTAWEIDQHWVIEHAEGRQEYICQAQSTNLFFPSGCDRKYINSVHMKAMKGEKIKSLYYLRTNSKVTADVVSKDWSDEECISCQG